MLIILIERIFFGWLISIQVLPLLNHRVWKQLIFKALCNQSVYFVVLAKVLLGICIHIYMYKRIYIHAPALETVAAMVNGLSQKHVF